MAYPSLAAGQTRTGVRAMQNGLHRALAAKGIAHDNKRNGSYGDLTIADVDRFKHAYGIRPVVGRYFGTNAWRALEPFLGKYDHALIDADLRLVKAAREARQQTILEGVHTVGARAAVAGAAVAFYNRCHDSYVYGQFRPMPAGLYADDAKDRLDCSSTAILVYKEASLPDPSGFDYNGSGDTGALWRHGTRVDAPQAGDLAFYGWESDLQRPGHVAICISSSEVVSFGHTPIERYPLRYRSDYLGARSYI